ncbi:MAG: chromosomal replication initiator protein DnaA [Planctomycetota bacterium]
MPGANGGSQPAQSRSRESSQPTTEAIAAAEQPTLAAPSSTDRTDSLGATTSLDAIWAAVLGDLETSLSAEKVARWFGSTSLLADDGAVVTVGVPNLFIQEWVQQRYLGAVQASVAARLGARRVKLRVDGQLYREFRRDEARFLEAQPLAALGENAPAPGRAGAVDGEGGPYPEQLRPGRAQAKNPLNDNFTLQRFVVAACNHVAFNAGLEVLHKPGKVYNPLFVFGGCGLGKTHLLQAIAREYFRHGRRRIRYLSCESFTNQFVQSLRKGNLDAFRNKFHNLEALVLDDVQILENKVKTQLELLHILDAIHGRGGQVICASDMRPRTIPNLHEQLQGRFISGLVCKVEAPDFGARLAILRGEAARVAVDVPESALHRIADAFSGNVRELIGAFVRVAAFGSLIQEPLTEDRVQSILDEQVWNQRRGVTLDGIVELVASRFGHTPDTLRSRSRVRSVSEARQLAIYLARVLTEHSLAELGTYFGGRNHATVNFAFRRVEKRIQDERPLGREVEEWIGLLQSGSR